MNSRRRQIDLHGRGIGCGVARLIVESVHRIVVCVTLSALLMAGCRAVDRGEDPRSALNDPRRFDPSDPLEREAAADPLGFLKRCIEHYDRTVEDYRCVFLQREVRDGQLPPEAHIAVRFRESPFSVDMHWIRHAGPARRVTYVAGRWRRGEKEYAHVEPAGLLRILAPQGVKRDIHAPDVRAAARGTIDRFGFRHTLADIISWSERAADHAEFDLRFIGTAVLADRDCLVFERRLPETLGGEAAPDRLLRAYIDRTWRVPIGCFAYADDAGKELLGSYITAEVELNVGLTDEDF